MLFTAWAKPACTGLDRHHASPTAVILSGVSGRSGRASRVVRPAFLFDESQAQSFAAAFVQTVGPLTWSVNSGTWNNLKQLIRFCGNKGRLQCSLVSTRMSSRCPVLWPGLKALSREPACRAGKDQDATCVLVSRCENESVGEYFNESSRAAVEPLSLCQDREGAEAGRS